LYKPTKHSPRILNLINKYQALPEFIYYPISLSEIQMTGERNVVEYFRKLSRKSIGVTEGNYYKKNNDNGCSGPNLFPHS
jgi:hypothetical protein